MTKKIIGGIAVIALIILGFAGYRYYVNTYQGQVGYAQVPTKVPTKEQTKDDSGKVVRDSYSYNYQLDVVKADGSTQSVPVEISGANPTPLTPNGYVKIEFSSKRVLKGPNNITKDQIPSKVQNVLDK